MENRRLAPRRGVQVRDYERLQFFFYRILAFYRGNRTELEHFLDI